MYEIERRYRWDMIMCRILLIAVIAATAIPLIETALLEYKKEDDKVIEDEVVDGDPPDVEEPIVPEPEEPIEPIEPPVVEDEVVEEVEQETGYYDVPLEEKLQDHIFSECEFYDVDPAVVVSIIKKESEFRTNVKGDKGRSYGLMQIQKRWHEDRMKRLGCKNLLNPYQNVTVGIDYLAELLDRGKGLEWALMAYNGGPSYANKLRAQGIVSKYAKAVIEYADSLERA